jgi:teichoic acid transport system ATP-binding protein
MKPKVIFKDVSKQYSLLKKKSDKLRDIFLPQKRGMGFFALKDISFEVYEGETIGVIGINGSGKSTLSNLLAQVVPPSSGEIVINGETSLIAISAGLNNHLSGIENIRLKCLMLGMDKKEIAEILPLVIDFADIGDFIGQPVKSYSSGMKARLGFAISVHTNPDILVIDEALSVGDQTFYQKCVKKVNEFKKQGKTIFFISHSLAQMRTFCDRVMWLSFGQLVAFGETADVLQKYNEFVNDFNKLSEADKKKFRNDRLRGQNHKIESVLDKNSTIDHEFRMQKIKRKKEKKKQNKERFRLMLQVGLLLLIILSSAVWMFFSNKAAIQAKSDKVTKPAVASVHKSALKTKTTHVMKNGYLISDNVTLYKDNQQKKKMDNLSFATPLLVKEELGKGSYKVTINGEDGYLKSNEVVFLKEGKAQEVDFKSFLPFLPQRAFQSYEFFLNQMGKSYTSVSNNLNGATEAKTDSRGLKVLTYGYEGVSYQFDKNDLVQRIIFSPISVTDPSLLNEAAFHSKDNHFYFFETKDYSIVLNMKTNEMTIYSNMMK